MSNIAKWSDGASAPPFPTTLLSGAAINSTSDATFGSVSATQDNLTTGKDMFADLALHLASLSPGTGAYIDVYILVALDSTPTFPAAGTALRNQPAQKWCTFQLDTAAATAQDIVIRGLPLPNAKFQVIIDNHAGVALAASGNTLKMQTYNVNLNG